MNNVTYSCMSLKFVAILCENEPSQTVRKPLQTLHEAEETFFAKYHIKIGVSK